MSSSTKRRTETVKVPSSFLYYWYSATTIKCPYCGKTVWQVYDTRWDCICGLG